MELLYYIILGLIQGLTEFLPVSSSGHLVLLNKLFGFGENFLFVSILLHIATLFAVVIVLKKEVLYLVLNPFSKTMQRLLLATLPTIAIVLIFKDFINTFFAGKYLGVCFIITAILLFVSEMFFKQKQHSQIKKSSAVLMGVAQGIAVVPGISRSGATISAGLLCGEEKTSAAKFSFLMSIPIIICSLIYEIYNGVKNGTQLFGGNILFLIVGFVVAFFTGIFAIKTMIKIVSKGTFWYFSVYLVLLGIFTIFIL